jgi:hypothetical protein
MFSFAIFYLLVVGLLICKRSMRYIASEYGNNNATISTIRSFMQKHKNKTAEKIKNISALIAAAILRLNGAQVPAVAK